MYILINLLDGRYSKGQSLVETAIFLPIFIILLGGVAEISNLLITQNRVMNATRVSAGFAAANFQTEQDWQEAAVTGERPFWASKMGNQAIDAIATTMDTSEEIWDIWAIKATVNAAATGFSEWTAEHAYGAEQIVSRTAWPESFEPSIQGDILAELQAGNSSAGGLRIVATVSYFKNQPLLGLPATRYLEVTRSLSVMRVERVVDEGGCALFPIAVHLENYSLYPRGSGFFPEFPTFNENSNGYYWIGKNATPPQPPPSYTPGNISQFPTNLGGVHILDALDNGGYIYLIKEAEKGAGGWSNTASPGGFGWLSWNGDQGTPSLANSLAYPGNSDIYNSPSPWADDGVINRFDLVHSFAGSTSGNAVLANLADLVDRSGRGAAFLVMAFTPRPQDSNFPGDWGSPTNLTNPLTGVLGGGEGDPDGFGTQGTGSGATYEVYRFPLVRFLAFNATNGQGGPWILIQFIKWADNNCQ